MSRPSVAVLGLGPAGRALAHRLDAHGATVTAVDPHPQRPWTQTFGVWRSVLPGWLAPEVVGAAADDTVIRGAGGDLPLFDRYVVLDTAALQRSLSLDGVRVLPRVTSLADAAGLADVVVDCRGSRPRIAASRSTGPREGRAHTSEPGAHAAQTVPARSAPARTVPARSAPARTVPAQTAFGLKLPADVAAPLLAGRDAVLMDWRPADGAASWGERAASFSYVVPLPDGRVLVEETCLVGAPAPAPTRLRPRLLARLRRAGVDPRAIDAAEAERVHIPMTPEPRPPGTARFGAAGVQLNPISGYSVGASLHQADAAARSLLTTGRLPGPGPVDAILHWAQGAVVHLGGDATQALFEGFGRLPAADQRRILLPAGETPARLLVSLTRQWLRMPATAGAALVLATARGMV